MTFESHLEELPEDAPWDQKPGESQVEQLDVDQIPEVDITEEDLLESGENNENWLIYGNNYENQRHYVGEEITPENVDQLEVEYQFEHLSTDEEFQGSPIIVQGDPPIMYLTFGPDIIQALNARTGEFLWTHQYEPFAPLPEVNPGAHRGVAVLGDRVYTSTLDFGVMALDRYTGEEEWYYNGAASYRGEVAEDVMHEELVWERPVGSNSSWPPIIYDGQLQKGSFGGEWGCSGFFDSIDLDGNPVWRVNMTPEHEWVGDSWEHGGATAWPAGALDPVTETTVIPSANPGPWHGTVRPGWNPYSAGKVGVDATTGEYNWHFQDAPHDWWDYDSSNPPVVFEAEVDGETRRMTSWAGKTGWVYTIDLETGQLVQRSDEYVQHLNMWALPPRDDLDAAPWVMTELRGGTNPQANAWDPDSQTMVLKGTNRPMKFAWHPVEFEIGERYVGMDTIRPADPEEVPEWNGYASVITGIDPVSGEVKWQDWLDTEFDTAGGCVSTATGITFLGLPEGEFVAYESATGERLWEDEIGTDVDGDPVIWHDPYEEKTYIAVTAGGRRGLEGNVVTVYSLNA
ncbi:outer membrane protein assembly factor BamB family protein [Natrialbaceae archaeon A-gly3]